jgi:hypothetical protein
MRKHRWFAILAILGVVVGVCASLSGAAAADSTPLGVESAPVGVVTADAATISDGSAVAAPAAPKDAFINRPTIPMDQYRALKTAQAPLQARPQMPAPRTITNKSGGNGISQSSAGGFFPSDSNGVFGAGVLVSVTNVHVTVYNPATFAQTSDKTLNAVAGYNTETLFDPRIIYDSPYKRFIIGADAFPESTSVQDMFLMVSRTSSPSAAYWVYALNVAGLCGSASSNPFWDYPQIGQTQDAVIVTANCFQGNSYAGARTFAVAKSIVFNGLGFSVPVFSPSSADGTTTPANVYDQNPTNYLITTNQHMIGFVNPQAGFYGGLGTDNAISGFQTFAQPRAAGQAGCTTTSCQLDTSDGRFVQDSSQFGDQLWNVATYGFGGTNGSFATPYWGQFSIANHNTTQKGAAIADGCSDDFNASLLANPSGFMWINWTSTDPQGSSCGQTFVRQMLGGRKTATASGALSNITNAFTSPAELTGDFDSNFGLQRWGDTSSVSGAGTNLAITFNNSVADANNWGTRWQKVANN